METAHQPINPVSNVYQFDQIGLTKREYFACQLMAAAISKFGNPQLDANEYAKVCIGYADALLKALES